MAGLAPPPLTDRAAAPMPEQPRSDTKRRPSRIERDYPQIDANGHACVLMKDESLNAEGGSRSLRSGRYARDSFGPLPLAAFDQSRTKLSATPNTRMPMAQNASPLRLAIAQFTLAYIIYRQPIASSNGVTG